VRAAWRGVRDGLSDGDEVDRGWRLEVGLRELVFPGEYEEDQSAPLKCMQPVSTNEEEGEERDSELVAILALNEVGATRVPQPAQALGPGTRGLLCLVLTTSLSCSTSTTRNRSATMATLDQSRQVFEILSKTLGFIPVVGENLKSAAELASKICEEIEVHESLPIIIGPLIYDIRVVIDDPG
jgi:hypothetical protein